MTGYESKDINKIMEQGTDLFNGTGESLLSSDLATSMLHYLKISHVFNL